MGNGSLPTRFLWRHHERKSDRCRLAVFNLFPPLQRCPSICTYPTSKPREPVGKSPVARRYQPHGYWTPTSRTGRFEQTASTGHSQEGIVEPSRSLCRATRIAVWPTACRQHPSDTPLYPSTTYSPQALCVSKLNTRSSQSPIPFISFHSAHRRVQSS